MVGAILAPVGIRTKEGGFLTVIGEVFEQLLSKQLTSFIDPMLNNNLTSYQRTELRNRLYWIGTKMETGC